MNVVLFTTCTALVVAMGVIPWIAKSRGRALGGWFVTAATWLFFEYLSKRDYIWSSGAIYWVLVVTDTCGVIVFIIGFITAVRKPRKHDLTVI